MKDYPKKEEDPEETGIWCKALWVDVTSGPIELGSPYSHEYGGDTPEQDYHQYID